MSKPIRYPVFSPLPKTGAANVIENIRLWIKNENKDRLRNFCRPDDSETGYRFVRDEDFLETIEMEQTILRRKVRIVFTRYAETRDHFCPLYFTTGKITVEIHYKDNVHTYKNDNRLRQFLKASDGE
ncbi:MAG: hypothetical protein LBS20_11585 [Prevotella sp.]|jgi:hypothetical protein|nr:hypothetical protein [Prevotella sp.]